MYAAGDYAEQGIQIVGDEGDRRRVSEEPRPRTGMVRSPCGIRRSRRCRTSPTTPARSPRRSCSATWPCASAAGRVGSGEPQAAERPVAGEDRAAASTATGTKCDVGQLSDLSGSRARVQARILRCARCLTTPAVVLPLVGGGCCPSAASLIGVARHSAADGGRSPGGPRGRSLSRGPAHPTTRGGPSAAGRGSNGVHRAAVRTGPGRRLAAAEPRASSARPPPARSPNSRNCCHALVDAQFRFQVQPLEFGFHLRAGHVEQLLAIVVRRACRWRKTAPILAGPHFGLSGFVNPLRTAGSAACRAASEAVCPNVVRVGAQLAQ